MTNPNTETEKTHAHEGRRSRRRTPETRAEWFRFIVTVFVLVGVMIVLWVALANVTSQPFKDPSGSIVDPFGRAGTVVAVVIPFVTLTLGYWFGSKGAETANERAAAAQEQAAKASDQAAAAHGKATLLASAISPRQAKNLVKNNPTMFGPQTGSVAGTLAEGTSPS